MTDTERIAKLEKELSDLRQAFDVVFAESLKKRVLNSYVRGQGTSDPSAYNQSVAGDAAFTSPVEYDDILLVETADGQYYIGLHNL